MALALRPAAAVTESSVPLRTFVTLVLWLGCLATGMLGFVLPCSPRQPTPAFAPIPDLEIPIVELRMPSHGQPQPGQLPFTAPTAAPPGPPSLPPSQAIPPAPHRLQTLSPQPFSISAFADAAPSSNTPTSHASTTVGTAPTVSSPPPPPNTPPAQDILAQPAPEYPRAARQAGQQGEVRVALTVGPDGRITQARIQVSSRWPLLDQEALRTVREKWRFAPGAERRYVVPIQFHLRK